MAGCCAPYEEAATRQFDRQRVAAELRRYRAKGPGRTARLLADGLSEVGRLAGTVLDVGAGIGGLTFALLERGAVGAVAVDASSSYVEAAREEAVRQGRAGAVRFVHADFVAAAPELAPAAIVTLDRVVCCYPAYDRLLDAALALAERSLALSYPRDASAVRLGNWLENALRRARGSPFRTFVHPAGAMERRIEAAGFVRRARRTTWVWAADVYTRSAAS